MEKLVHAARQLFGLCLTGRQVVALRAFENELLDWNKKFNLTAIRDIEGIRTKHFLDSFSCALAWKENPPQTLDRCGHRGRLSGYSIENSLSFHGVEAGRVGRKKASFCRHVVGKLKLDAVEVISARAEEVGQMPGLRESFDWAVARAVHTCRCWQNISCHAASRRQDVGPERSQRTG